MTRRNRTGRRSRRRLTRWGLARWGLGLGALLLGTLGTAGARTVKIVTADRLELRKVTGDLLPDGSRAPDQEIVVISGEKVELRLDADVILATRVEYNRTRRTLTIVGAGEYDTVQSSGTQVLRGSDLVVDLGSEQLSGEDVLISDAQLEIRGEAVSRVPGQLTASNSYFTPCARCGRTPNDYAFRARSVLLYPGDRLVAYDATLLLADAPVFFLPVVVLPLQDQDRQPSFSIGQSAPDGLTVQADLPFSVGSSTLGTTLLRYYQNRSPSFGFGVDLRSYAPLPGVDRLNLFALVNPRPLNPVTNADGTVTSNFGYEVNLNFSVRGRLAYGPALDASTVGGSGQSSTGLGGIDYRFSATRNDIGRADSDPLRGVTNLSGTASASFPDYTLALNYTDRLGPDPTSALPNVLARPEIVFDPKPYLLGKFSADFRVSVGNYTAASNPLSRSAQAQGPNFSTARLEESHVISYSATPWPNGDFTVNNTFTGRYYLTGARVVNLSAGAGLTQTLSSGNTLALSYLYQRQEGTSPFAFDAQPIRPPSSALGVALNLTPALGFTVSAAQSYDFFQPSSAQSAARFGVQLQKAPVTATLNLNQNFFTGDLEALNLDAVVGQDQPLVLGVRAGYTLLGGPGLLSVSADAVGGPRSNTFGVTLNYDLKQTALSSVNLRAGAVGTQDTVLSPLSFSAAETIRLQTGTAGMQTQAAGTQAAGLSGQATLNAQGLQFTTSHTLTFTPGGNPGSDSVFFGVGGQPGSAFSWSVRYGGPYDTARLGFTRPALSAALSATRPGQRLAAQASLNLPGLDQSLTELGSASVAGSYDLGSFFLNGGAYYNRTRTATGTAEQTVTDTLAFQPLTVTAALGSGPKPGAYISATLRNTLTWQNGVLQAPGRIEPILLFTVDRCCWAFQIEINPVDRRYRIGFSLPGGGFTPALDVTGTGVSVPLLTPRQP